MPEWIYESATAMAAAIREKQISSYDLVRACLGRIEEVNPRLNAVVQICSEQALKDARESDQALAREEVIGPLHGVSPAEELPMGAFGLGGLRQAWIPCQGHR